MIKRIFISIFVIVWLVIFHYESTRHFFLEPLVKKELPKLKFLFPPAGWIMFFNVDDQFGYVEVYGIKGSESWLIDPHDIVETRTIMFDNINRNILSSVAGSGSSQAFCHYLHRKFPYFDKFAVTSVYYPSLIHKPFERYQQVNYQCVN